VMWIFTETHHVPTRWEKVRTECSCFFLKLGMRTLSRRFGNAPRQHYITSTDLKE
jgi:hypothetical protein